MNTETMYKLFSKEHGHDRTSGCYNDKQMYLVQFEKQNDGTCLDAIISCGCYKYVCCTAYNTISGRDVISGCYRDNQMYIVQFAKWSDGHFVDMVMTSGYSSDLWTCVVQLTKQSDGKFVDAIMTSGCYRDDYMYVIQLTKQSDMIMVLFKKSFL